MKTRLKYAAVILLTAFAVAPSKSADITSENSDSKPLALNSVNESFRKDYAKAKQEIRQQLGPLILCINDDLIFLNGKNRQTAKFIKARYTGLKEVSHITLDTFVLLTNHTDTTLEEPQIERLKQFRNAVAEASPKVKTDEALAASDEPKEAELIQQSLVFLDKVIAEKKVSQTELTNFVRSTTRSDMDNAYEAAGTQLTAMDNAVQNWRSAVSPTDWEKLRVVIVTHHMPRQELVAFQYFQKILHQAQEGDRVVVAETITDVSEEQAIDLLLTHMLDRKIGIAFFNDPWRMHRDLLADGAKEWLSKHPPKALSAAATTR